MSPRDHHIQYVPEPPTVKVRFVGWTALAALLLVLVAIFGGYGVYRAAVSPNPPPAPQAFPEPRVNTTEKEELRRIQDAQNAKLKAWGWADDQHTLVQIPIERAMQLLAAKGANALDPLLPAQAALSPPTAAAEQATIQHQRASSAAPSTSGEPSAEGKP